jgi:iron complex transport system permease protein
MPEEANLKIHADKNRLASRGARRLFLLVGGVALIFIIGTAGVTVGSADLSPGQALRVLCSKVFPFLNVSLEGIREVDQRIVWLLRAPRVVLAGLVGAMLALAGVQLQGLFRNPLAAPGLIGTSQGAALGAVLAISSGLNLISMFYLPAFAFIGAFLALALIAALAVRDGRTSVGMLLLAGVALNFLLSAIISLVVSLTLKDWEAGSQIMSWLMGGLDEKSWIHVRITFPCLVAGYVLVRWFARDLDLLLEGEESAKSLGVETERVKYGLLVATALFTGSAVAVSGVIGFVGLIIPHLVRLLIGPSHRSLNPVCAITGAWFLIGADLIARTVDRPEEIRLGIVTALVGAPFFLFLLVRSRKELDIL